MNVLHNKRLAMGLTLERVRFYSILLHAPIKLLQFFRKINENDIFSSDTNYCYVGGIISGGNRTHEGE